MSKRRQAVFAQVKVRTRKAVKPVVVVERPFTAGANNVVRHFWCRGCDRNSEKNIYLLNRKTTLKDERVCDHFISANILQYISIH